MDFDIFNGENAAQWQAYAIEYGTSIFFAILIFFVGKIIAKFAVTLVRKSLKKAKMDDMLVSFVGNISYTLAMAFVIIAALSELGVETTSLAAIFAAAGLAIGLSLQGSLSNFASGVLIVAFRPFKKGDFVEVAGTSGVISDISIFTTTLKTGDNKTVIIPNGGITSGNIINYSTEKTRRIDMVIGCGYDDDLKKTKALLIKLLTADKRVLKDPEPSVALSELADSCINFNVRPWVKSEDYWSVRSDLLLAIKEAFDKEGISIPYPQQDVHMHAADAANDTKPAPKKSPKKVA
jgi:small conductance mechanosensitive channel